MQDINSKLQVSSSLLKECINHLVEISTEMKVSESQLMKRLTRSHKYTEEGGETLIACNVIESLYNLKKLGKPVKDTLLFELFHLVTEEETYLGNRTDKFVMTFTFIEKFYQFVEQLPFGRCPSRIVSILSKLDTKLQETIKNQIKVLYVDEFSLSPDEIPAEVIRHFCDHPSLSESDSKILKDYCLSYFSK
jgi:hypothetical protein